jgi:small subunit ribosomal protein S17
MPRKQKIGIVVSDKMQKSIVVEVTRIKQHPLYKKFLRIRKKFMAHDEENTASAGDVVRIEESRPLSRRKSWVLKEILRVAPGHGKQESE